MTQMSELARPFPDSLIKTKPDRSKASYVEHSDVTQRLLEVVGPFDQHVVQVVRGDVAGPERTDRDSGEKRTLPDLKDAVVGVVLSLTLTVDGRVTTVEEIGEVEHPHNHATDASRLKFAVSDGIKRCAMRLGLGLHLWCQDHYYLDKSLAKRVENA